MENQTNNTQLQSSDNRIPHDNSAWITQLCCFIGGPLIFLMVCYIMHNLVIDDAYITYRFAARLADQGNLAWNALEAPVEGYTSFLAVLLTIPFLWLDLDPLIAWKVMGVFFGIGSVLAVCFAVRVLLFSSAPNKNNVALYSIIGLYIFMNPLMAIHAMSGMETMLFVFLLNVTAAFAYHSVFSNRRRPIVTLLLPIFALLLGMTRPEGALWGLGVLVAVWIGLPDSERKKFAKLICLGFVLPGAIYFISRWMYFGELLPATFHAKAGAEQLPGVGRLDTFLPSWREVVSYLKLKWGYLIISCILMTLIAISKKIKWTRRKSFLVLVPALSLFCIMFYARINVHIMGYGYRFFFPFGQTFWLTLVGPFLAMMLRNDIAIKPSKTLAYYSQIIFISLAVGSIFFLSSLEFLKTGRDKKSGKFTVLIGNDRRNRTYEITGRALDEAAVMAGRTLTIFHHNMGRLMYYAPHCDSIDPVGLVDMYTAKNGFSIDHVFERKPDFFLLPSKAQDRITEYAYEPVFPDISRAMYLDPRMADFEYLGFVPGLNFWTEEGRMHLLVRKSLLAENESLRSMLQNRLSLVRLADFQ